MKSNIIRCKINKSSTFYMINFKQLLFSCQSKSSSENYSTCWWIIFVFASVVFFFFLYVCFFCSGRTHWNRGTGTPLFRLWAKKFTTCQQILSLFDRKKKINPFFFNCTQLQVYSIWFSSHFFFYSFSENILLFYVSFFYPYQMLIAFRPKFKPFHTQTKR